MNCENYEKEILEVLDKKELSKEILSHVNKCQSCSNFYGYIAIFKKDLKEIEKLEPSPDFDMRVIEKLKVQPAYWKILTFVSSFVVFISFLFVSLIVKRYFAQIAVFCGKTLKVFEVLSGVFSYSFYTVAILFFLGIAFFVIVSSVLDIFLLSKLIKNGGKL